MECRRTFGIWHSDPCGQIAPSRRHPAWAKALPPISELFLHIDNALLIPLVEGPLLDTLCPKHTRLDEDAKMLTGRGLSNTEFLRDEQTADSVFHEVAFHLWRKMRAWVLQPTHDLQSALIGERFQDVRRQ